MADVRSGVGAATTGVFTGPVGNQIGTPVYIDLSTGDVSFLLPGDVIFTLNIASIIIAAQSLGNHLQHQPTNVQDVNEHMAIRAFDRQVIANEPSPQEAQWQLADRTFSRAIDNPALADNAAIVNEASNILKNRTFNRAVERTEASVQDTQWQLGDRALSRAISDTPLLNNEAIITEASNILKNRVFNRGVDPIEQSVQSAQWQLGDRVFSRAVQPPPQAASASDILMTRSFARQIFPSWWQ